MTQQRKPVSDPHPTSNPHSGSAMNILEMADEERRMIADAGEDLWCSIHPCGRDGSDLFDDGKGSDGAY